MATAFSYSTSVVQFRYPSQKTTANPVSAHFRKTTANPVLGHATRKLLKPLYNGVRALHQGCRSEIGFNGTEWECETRRIRGQREKFTCEDKIQELLRSNCSTDLTNLAKSLSKKLKHIGGHPEEKGGLVSLLYKDILKEEHISTMWKIAGYNCTDTAADMLPFKNIQSPVKWAGKSGDIREDRKRKRGDEEKPLKQFPLEGKWEMELHRCGDGEAYINVVFKGKSRFPRERKGRVLVDNNLNGIPADVKPFRLAFVFGADGPWPSSNHFVIYMRAAGPNVLVGEAWAGGEAWAEVVIVKRK